jgi:hypothetical protein
MVSINKTDKYKVTHFASCALMTLRVCCVLPRYEAISQELAQVHYNRQEKSGTSHSKLKT